MLTALLATGRAGSATTAEIGTMVATEQLDGLRMMSVDPVHFVVTPKALAMIAVMPLLSALFIVCRHLRRLSGRRARHGARRRQLHDAACRTRSTSATTSLGSLLKALVFGVLVGLIATYRGYTTAPTSAGVSSATTSTVVIASVSILIFDYFITALWGV